MISNSVSSNQINLFDLEINSKKLLINKKSTSWLKTVRTRAMAGVVLWAKGTEAIASLGMSLATLVGAGIASYKLTGAALNVEIKVIKSLLPSSEQWLKFWQPAKDILEHKCESIFSDCFKKGIGPLIGGTTLMSVGGGAIFGLTVAGVAIIGTGVFLSAYTSAEVLIKLPVNIILTTSRQKIEKMAGPEANRMADEWVESANRTAIKVIKNYSQEEGKNLPPSKLALRIFTSATLGAVFLGFLDNWSRHGLLIGGLSGLIGGAVAEVVLIFHEKIS